MNVKTKFKCRCNISTMDVVFRRPNFMGHTMVAVVCKDCASEYMIKFSRKKILGKSRESNLLNSQIKITKVSDTLSALMKEEEEYKNGQLPDSV